MFVGEAPGEEEERVERPFVGRAGRLLKRSLKALRVSRRRVYLTTLLKRRTPRSRMPTPSEIKSSLPRLYREIRKVSPRVVVTLGMIPTQALLGTASSVGRLHGKVYGSNGFSIFVMYHPAYVLRNPEALGTFERDLRKALRMAELI